MVKIDGQGKGVSCFITAIQCILGKTTVKKITFLDPKSPAGKVSSSRYSKSMTPTG